MNDNVLQAGLGCIRLESSESRQTGHCHHCMTEIVERKDLKEMVGPGKVD